MDLKLHLIDTFPAQGSDGQAYKVCAYERLRRDATLNDGQEHWLPTGVTELRLDSGALIDARGDNRMTVAATGVELKRA